MTVGLQRRHHPQFMRRGNTRVDLDRLDFAFEILVAHRLQFGAGHHAPCLKQTQFACHGLSRYGMVAGDHYRANAGLRASGDGAFGFGARRIDHACQP